ncbi:tRNA (adenosine(37)-N6)-threonylcarbamoyltransferase complex dimerization subunit type 1 TsaB [Alphaproteobacteria bacterium KMM 3653]|uniref:tRNA (Adenosine(37)-N6)-threonylcarbamoyltransferase complex dimerization subunit type 1 TsaB n=1 Tax=Harenicola maris TaxID=2841044 RepID=A0AAP2G6J8_9RHOB|nr:tRNA (adenosine(37)-N6)-threonylcarbamoyltransferase complex dimerization subunit type 1 TsaB [Harenicola maris]
MILAFDTSGPSVSAALLSQDETLLAALYEDMAKGQAERLMPMVAEVMHEAGADMQDLTRIAVGIGPGNFTGIRIAVSAARGMALALGIPATGVSLLDALTHGTSGPVIATLPAPRGLIYAQGYGGAAPAAPILTDPATLTLGAATVIGPPAEMLLTLAKGGAEAGAKAAPAAFAPASAIARVAHARTPNPAERPSPLYLRPADAAPARNAPPVITG